MACSYPKSETLTFEPETLFELKSWIMQKRIIYDIKRTSNSGSQP